MRLPHRHTEHQNGYAPTAGHGRRGRNNGSYAVWLGLSRRSA